MKITKWRRTIPLILATGLFCSISTIAADGPSVGGGGDTIAAQYANVVERTLKALKMVCASSESETEQKLCSNTSRLIDVAKQIKVLPRKKDSILGDDGNPRDAGNNGVDKIYLDIDRWKQKMNEKDISKIPRIRQDQVLLSLHEPLVLLNMEKNDNYSTSNSILELLKRNSIDLNTLVNGYASGAHEEKRAEFIFNASRWLIPSEIGKDNVKEKNCDYASSLELAKLFASRAGFYRCSELTEKRIARPNTDGWMECNVSAKCDAPIGNQHEFTGVSSIHPRNPSECNFQLAFAAAKDEAGKLGYTGCTEKKEERTHFEYDTNRLSCVTTAICELTNNVLPKNTSQSKFDSEGEKNQETLQQNTQSAE